MLPALARESCRFVQRSGVLQSPLGDSEVVLLDPQQGFYFGAEGVGKVIWDALAAPASVDELVRAVMAQFPDVSEDVCRADVRAFLDELERVRLIEASTGSI